MKAYIKSISYYLPEVILTNEDLVKQFPEWTIEKVASKIGINKRHICGENETVVSMAIKAAQQMFQNDNINPREIDFVLLCTQSPDYFLPTSACIVQNELGIPTSAGALDFNLGCSGYIYGLSLAKGLILSQTAKNILLITSESYSKHIHPKDKSNRTIFGDAASATLISDKGSLEILNFSFGTDGRGENNLKLKTGGLKFPYKLNDLYFDENQNPISSDYLFMNGSEIFNFTLENVPKLAQNTLKNNTLSMSDINLYIFHQANKYMLNFLRKKIGIEEEKFYYFIENVGNTVSSTIPIALKEAINENKINGNIMLAGFGVGYSWGGVVLQA